MTAPPLNRNGRAIITPAHPRTLIGVKVLCDKKAGSRRSAYTFAVCYFRLSAAPSASCASRADVELAALTSLDEIERAGGQRHADNASTHLRTGCACSKSRRR